MVDVFDSYVDKFARFKDEKRVKDSRTSEVVEEVFDYPTLMSLYKLLNEGTVKLVYGVVATGKEARIYWAESPDGKDLALKIYLTKTSEFRRGRIAYVEGDPRFKKLRKNTRKIVELWCLKEFRNLYRAQEAGVRVPKPLARAGNVLVMEFIGLPGARGKPAPLLKDVRLDQPEEALEILVEYVKLLYKGAKLVHADLSEYNVMVRGEELVIIDFGSAVDISHPRSVEFLRRDVMNIFSFFSRLGVDVIEPERLIEEIVAS